MRRGVVDLGLQRQTPVIVGGARGIGRAIAMAFAAEGANVAVIDRDPEAEAVARALGEKHRGFVADVTDYAAVRRAAAEIAQGFGRTDHIVFAVGIGSGKY